ncbi:hypothetical protein GCM10010234_47280 [Streptomyces hawaiiensis]|uniref:PIN domain-containing protein n=1 Tax=Streptomyces hawaiiensis TaxID=67305 RepID=UPI0031D50714
MSEYHRGSFTAGYEEFWRKSQSSIDEAIETYQIVLDTNAVLNLYRMNASARGEYLHVLETIANRIWIPRQVADEFHRNRLSSVSAHIRALNDKSDAVMSSADSFVSSLRDFARLYSIAGSAKAYIAPFSESIEKIKQAVKSHVDEFDLSPERLVSDDPILRRLAVIFDNRVGVGIPSEQRQEVQKEAERREREKIPPGYKDAAKKGDGGYGDYFIWQEMLDRALEVKRPILFVSTDVKEDWVRVQCGLAVGPRPELVTEMHRVAGVEYYQITLAAFLARAASVLKVPVSQETLDQVTDRSDTRRKLKRDLSEMTSVLGTLNDEAAAVQRILQEAEQREAMAAGRLAATRDGLSRVDRSDPEWAQHSAELEYFEASRDEASLARRLAQQQLASIAQRKAVALDAIKLIEVQLEG